MFNKHDITQIELNEVLNGRDLKSDSDEGISIWKFPISKRHAVAYMSTCFDIAALSHAARRRAGAVIVKPDRDNSWRTVSTGYNGTPPGEDNCCEGPDGQSLPSVRHAERTALTKLARSSESIDSDTILICTMSPCEFCAERIIELGIKLVIYCEKYRLTDGLDALEKAGVDLHQVSWKDVAAHKQEALRLVHLAETDYIDGTTVIPEVDDARSS